MAFELKAWWQKWRFGFALSGALIASEIAALLIMLQQTPSGMHWLGDMVFNAVDYPVYFSYLGQSQKTWAVRLLYNDLGPIARLEPFWSSFGQLTRFGLSPLAIHEGARWLMTLVLGLSICLVIRELYVDQRRSRLAALIMASGSGLGWLFAIASNIATGSILAPVPPDISTQFSLIPILFGGAHMILSLALQFLIARWTWLLLGKNEKKYLWPDLFAAFLLSAFHPYYIPFIGLMAVISLWSGRRLGGLQRRWFWFLGICGSLLPSTLYNYWLTRQDAALGQLYFHTNALPLGGWPDWIMSLGAIILAAVFMLLKRVPHDYYWDVKPDWAWVWLISAIICMLLPFPWTAKYTQGLLPVMAILTMPFWLWAWDRLTRPHPSIKLFCQLSGVLFLSAPLLYYWCISSLLSRSQVRALFYQPIAVFQAWDYMRATASDDAVIISDNMHVNLWTPAYALRTVWVGHGHGTPNYEAREKTWSTWLGTQDATDYNRFLDEHRITYLLEVNQNARQATDLLDSSWSQFFKQDEVMLWKKTN